MTIETLYTLLVIGACLCLVALMYAALSPFSRDTTVTYLGVGYRVTWKAPSRASAYFGTHQVYSMEVRHQGVCVLRALATVDGYAYVDARIGAYGHSILYGHHFDTPEQLALALLIDNGPNLHE